jgi:hypothetical protein
MLHAASTILYPPKISLKSILLSAVYPFNKCFLGWRQLHDDQGFAQCCLPKTPQAAQDTCFGGRALPCLALLRAFSLSLQP